MMKGGLGGMMKQAQQMQLNMQKVQAELATMEVEGHAGSGMVQVIMTCAHEVRRVSLDDSLLTEDKEMLEDLIVLAINDAMKKIDATTQQRMSGFTVGMGLPPGMKLPF
ncbi:MAG: nucleoid-associated protein, YbaB/EbfC family [Betaproteobacteria bacterium RBG_16_56_24]|nr:MAG: nucleoid-associated protein, YbaB/EbfC family [Betaproteobacteria bacterium RBG_16_56_24]